MVSPRPNEDVEQLLLNAQLRDELEPFVDESLEVLDKRFMSTQVENEYLASMLEWERAPVLPISRWFEPELTLPTLDSLDDAALHKILWQTIRKLYRQRIALEFTEHLSDRELYGLICRDILPSLEKKIDRTNRFVHWHCLDPDQDSDTWLKYYASDEERDGWEAATGQTLPPACDPPFSRKMPRRPR